MTKHWVRDVPLTDPANYIANGNHMMANAVTYHFLRVAGWRLLWECDGGRGSAATDPNHVPDGNVQVDSTAFWASYNGGTVSKDVVTVHSGTRSLKVVAAGAGEGVVSDPFYSMANAVSWTTGTGDTLSGPVGREMTYYDDTTRFSSGSWAIGSYLAFSGNSDPNNDGEFVISRYINGNSVKFENPIGSPVVYYNWTPPPPVDVASVQFRPRYEVAIWAATNVAFDVEVDQGDGSYVNIGTIPSNGVVFTEYNFFFRRLGSGGSTIRFVSQGAGTMYVGGINVYSSRFEKPALLKSGTDGVITNPDQFSSGSFTFDDSDVGRVLFLWDGTYNKNSGAYVITGVAAGVVTLDLRSGSAALVNSNNVRWRLDTIDYLTYPNYSYTDLLSYCGFGLESPHTSKWRFFLRQSQPNGQTGKGSIIWSAPQDTDFDFSSGNFRKSGPSTQRNRQVDWYMIPDSAIATGEHLIRGGYSYKTSPHDSRCFMMVDEDGAFISVFTWDEDGNHGCYVIGWITSALPGLESFHQATRWEGRGVANESFFDNSADRFSSSGTTFDSEDNAIPFCIAQLGIGLIAYDTIEVETQSNAGPNPWSGKEWLRPLIIWRDTEGNRQSAAIQITDCGLYQGRSNMVELTTFDSDGFLHLDNGLIWEWSGETVL